MGKLLVKKLHPDAITPTMAHPGEDLGFDLYALEDTFLYPHKQVIVKTGIAARYIGDLPPIDYFSVRLGPGGGAVTSAPKFGLKLFDRSSMAAKHGLLTMAGVIDAGYDGEIGVVMILLGPALTLHPDVQLWQSVTPPFEDVVAKKARITAEPWTEKFLATLTEQDRSLIEWFLKYDPTNRVGYQIKRGDKIAQMVPVQVYGGAVKVVDELSQGGRGGAGYGSSGR